MKQIMMAAGVLAVVVLVAAVFASIAPQPAAASECEMLYGRSGRLRWICRDGHDVFQSGAMSKWQRADAERQRILTTTIDER